MAKKVVILVQGGLVQAVYTDAPDLEVEVYDLDEPGFMTEEEKRELEARVERFEQAKESLLAVYCDYPQGPGGATTGPRSRPPPKAGPRRRGREGEERIAGVEESVRRWNNSCTRRGFLRVTRAYPRILCSIYSKWPRRGAPYGPLRWSRPWRKQ